MSNKEKAIHLLDSIPESKLLMVIKFLEKLRVDNIEEIEPDEWDLKMIESANKENDDVAVSIEDLAEELEIEL